MAPLIGRFIHPAGVAGCGKGVGWGIFILAHCKFDFFRVHDNLVLDPSNNKSIIVLLFYEDMLISHLLDLVCFSTIKRKPNKKNIF